MGKLSSRDRKLAHRDGQNVSNIENRQFATFSTSASQTILQGPLPVVATTGITSTAQRISWSYIGYTQKSLVVDYVQFIQMGAVPAGAQVAELGLATSTSAPDGTAKTLTCIASTGVLPDLTVGTFPSTLGIARQNTNALAYTVSPCTHLWAAIRTEFAGTQPTYLAVNLDLSVGFVQTTATVTSPLAVGTSYTGALYAMTVAATGLHPYLRLQIKA